MEGRIALTVRVGRLPLPLVLVAVQCTGFQLGAVGPTSPPIYALKRLQLLLLLLFLLFDSLLLLHQLLILLLQLLELLLKALQLLLLL